MNARLIHALCLGCGLLLALPPAWCCYTPRVTAAPTQPTCCQKAKAPQRAPVPPPAHCPCDDRDTISPSTPGKIAADVSFPTPLAVVVPDAPRAGPVAAAPVRLAFPQPLHILQCVWLC
jgi:hypothetical protein